MKRDDETLIVLIGIAALMALTSSRKTLDFGVGWVWPVPRFNLDGHVYAPRISNQFGAPHAGVDIAYRRRTLTDASAYKPGTPSGTPWHFAPAGVPIVAARAGKVWSVQKTSRGIAVVIDHGKPFASFYQHLSQTGFPAHAKGVNVATGKPTPIKAGDIIGTMGADPTDAEGFRHLHFAVWANGSGDSASVNPAAAMERWPYVDWIVNA